MERSGAGHELSDQAGLFRDLLDAAPDSLLITDGDGRIVFANAQTESLFGYGRDELIGQRIEILVPVQRRAEHVGHREGFAADPRKRPMGSGLALSARRKDGSEFPVEISLSPHRTLDGTLYSAAIRDITPRVAVEHELRSARAQAEQASIAKSRFLAAASHDLRQPLQAAILYNNVLKRQLADTLHAETAVKLESSLHALRDLLNRLLDISRLEAGAIAPVMTAVRLETLFEHMEDQFRLEAQNKHLELRIRPLPCRVRSDPQLLEQLLRNLVTNALRYTETGGVLIGCRRSGGELRIQVIDTGIGIPPQELDRIFDEFYQASNGTEVRTAGLGLGLAIVRGLSQLLGHPVSVRSRLGHGSVFEVRVPLAEARAADSDDAPALPRHRRALLIVIDDDAEVLDGLRLLLEQFGHEVVACSDPDSAMRRLSGYGRAPDLILTDYRLGNGVTGADAIRRLRTGLGVEHIPAIVVTGDSSTAALREVRAAGFPVLHKPVDPDQLELMIAQSLPRVLEQFP